MPTNVIFQKEKADRYIVKMDFESDIVTDSTNFSIASLVVIETLESSTPMLNAKFTDASGAIVEETPIYPDSNVKFSFGKNRENLLTYDFLYSHMELSNTEQTNFNDIGVRTDLITTGWPSLFKDDITRGWNNVPYSFVAERIAEEAGIPSANIFVETTQNVYDVIQPNWTNHKMLKWLEAHSVNRDSSGGYVYYFTLDNKFYFKSLNTIMAEPPKHTISHVGYSSTSDDNFGNIKINNNYMPVMTSGGFGVSGEYFDYDTGKNVTYTRNISDVTQNQLSDWVLAAKSHINSSMHINGGRDTDAIEVAENKIIKSMTANLTASFRVEGNTKYHVGDVITLKIPSPTRRDQKTTININYSGNWMIYKVAHVFDIINETYHTELCVTRSGVNGVNIQGLESTKSGKVIA